MAPDVVAITCSIASVLIAAGAVIACEMQRRAYARGTAALNSEIEARDRVIADLHRMLPGGWQMPAPPWNVTSEQGIHSGSPPRPGS